MVSSADPISASTEDGITTITLQRPHKLNAFDQEMLDRWHDALVAAEADPDCRAVIITGAGKGFCTGVDIDELNPAETEREFRARLEAGAHKVGRAIMGLTKPVIAAVNGPAIGAGLDMALMCDIRVAAREASLSFGYVRLGLFPGNGGTYLLPRIVGTAKALELLWTAQRFSGAEAADMGLVQTAVDADQVVPTSIELARRILESPDELIRDIKGAVYSGLRADWDDAFRLVAARAALLRGLPETRRRITDLQKRREA